MPGQGLNGIRLILAGMPLSRRTSSRASARRIVDALQHHVFEGDAARVGDARIGPAGLEQRRDRIFPVQRHEFVAQVVAHGVQRDRQHGADLAAERLDLRHDARRSRP